MPQKFVHIICNRFDKNFMRMNFDTTQNVVKVHVLVYSLSASLAELRNEL